MGLSYRERSFWPRLLIIKQASLECSRSPTPEGLMRGGETVSPGVVEKKYLQAVELNDFSIGYHPNFYERHVKIKCKDKNLSRNH